MQGRDGREGKLSAAVGSASTPHCSATSSVMPASRSNRSLQLFSAILSSESFYPELKFL